MWWWGGLANAFCANALVNQRQLYQARLYLLPGLHLARGRWAPRGLHLARGRWAPQLHLAGGRVCIWPEAD